jgi:hypothetical protein
LNREDACADTIRPRLHALLADLEHVFVLQGEEIVRPFAKLPRHAATRLAVTARCLWPDLASWAEFQSLLPLCPENTLERTTPAGVRFPFQGGGRRLKMYDVPLFLALFLAFLGYQFLFVWRAPVRSRTVRILLITLITCAIPATYLMLRIIAQRCANISFYDQGMLRDWIDVVQHFSELQDLPNRADAARHWAKRSAD